MTQGKTGWIRRSRQTLGHGGALLLLSVGLVACGEQGGVPPVPASGSVQFEAEEGPISPLAPQAVAEPRSGGRIINDPNASGGRAVALLGTNDNVRFVVPGSVKAGRYTVSVRGRGEAYRGWPIVDLNDARQRRLAVATLDSGTYVTRKFGEFDLKPGQVFNFSFINDLYEGRGKDRNAVVDYLVIEPVSEKPTGYAVQFGGGNSDFGHAVEVDAGGNAYVVGHTTGTLPGQTGAGGSTDAFVRKTNAQGQEVWTRQFGTDRADAASNIFLDAGGHIYVVGTLGGAYVNAPDAVTFVRKYSADGAELWTRQFTKGDPSQTFTATVDATGHLYLHGSLSGALPGQTNLGRRDAFVRKYAPDGTEVWARQFGTEGADNARLVRVDASGNVYVSGLTTGLFPGAVVDGGNVQYLSKFSASGAQLWTRQFGQSTVLGDLPTYKDYPLLFDSVDGLGVDQGGNVYLAGNVQGSFAGQAAGGSLDTFLRKYGHDGALLWTRQSQDARLDRPAFGSKTLGLDAAGNVYLAQFSSNPSSPTGEYKNAVLRYAPDGTLVGTRELDTGSAKDKTGYFDASPLGQGLAVSQGGTVFVTGETRGSLPGFTNAASDTDNGSADVFLFKILP